MKIDFKMISDKMSKELKFVIALCAKGMTTFQREIAVECYNKGLDWEEVSKLVKKNRVQPQFMKNLKSLGFMDESNEPLVDIKNQVKRYTFKSLRLTSELKKLVAVFEENGIKVISLKGPVLAKQIYGDIAMRTSADLDILIDIDDLPSAHNVLKSEGYSSFKLTPKRLRNTIKYHPDMEYVKGDIHVELHWKLNYFGYKRFNILYNYADIFKLNGLSIRTMSKTNNVLYLMLHASRHGYNRLRWLLDIYELFISGNIDFEELYKESVCGNLDIVLFQTFFVLYSIEIFDMPTIEFDKFVFSMGQVEIDEQINKEQMERLNAAKLLAQQGLDLIIKHENIVESLAFEKYKRRFAYLHRECQDIPMFYLRQKISPNHYDFELVDIPDSLYWLYYFVRPFNKLYRKIRRRL